MMLKLANMMRPNRKKGFTLVEMIVVIVIIAILAAALVTSLVGYVNKAKDTAAETEAHNVYTAIQAIVSEDSGTSAFAIIDKGDTTLDADELAALAAPVNKYLGSDIVAANKGSITAVKLGTGYTVTNMTYSASNGQTVTLDGTKWTVS